MILDVHTVLIAEALVVATAGVSFITGTILGRATVVGRIWSSAFTAGILAVLCYAVAEANSDEWTTGALGNGALVFAVGAMWSGCRVFNNRPSLISVPIILAVAAAIAALAEGPDGGVWAGALWLFLLIGVSAGAAAVECLRGNLKREPNGIALVVVFLVVALYYAARTTIVLIGGFESALFTQWFGTITTSLVVITLVTVASVSMSSLSIGRGSGVTGESAASDIAGILPRSMFDDQLTDWLRRGRLTQTPLVLIMLEVNDLEHLNSVFGHEFGDGAIRSVGRTAVDNAPVTSIVGRLSPRRFALLTPAPTLGAARAIAERLQTALVETPVDSIAGIRASASFGVASTQQVGYRVSDISGSARVALAEAVSTGRGEITVARSAAASTSPNATTPS